MEPEAAVSDAMSKALHEATFTKRISRNNPKALPAEILAKIVEKKELLKAWQRSRRPEDKSAVNRASAQVTRLIADHTQASWRNACGELGRLRSSSTAFWKRLAQFSDEKSRARHIHKLKLDSGATTTEPKAISECFATSLASVFQVFQGDEFDDDF